MWTRRACTRSTRSCSPGPSAASSGPPRWCAPACRAERCNSSCANLHRLALHCAALRRPYLQVLSPPKDLHATLLRSKLDLRLGETVSHGGAQLPEQEAILEEDEEEELAANVAEAVAAGDIEADELLLVEDSEGG